MPTPPRIVSSPEILGGTPVLAGPCVPIKNVMDYLEAGETMDEFLDSSQSVMREQVVQVLGLANAARAT